MVIFMKKRVHFKSEPLSMYCPRCNSLMIWSTRQGPMGGWICHNCGLKIDHK